VFLFADKICETQLFNYRSKMFEANLHFRKNDQSIVKSQNLPLLFFYFFLILSLSLSLLFSFAPRSAETGGLSKSVTQWKLARGDHPLPRSLCRSISSDVIIQTLNFLSRWNNNAFSEQTASLTGGRGGSSRRSGVPTSSTCALGVYATCNRIICALQGEKGG